MGQRRFNFTMKVHVYDFRWNDEKSFEFQASKDQRFGVKKLQIGDTLSLRVISDLSCAGSRRDGNWQPCPDQVQGKKKCEVCRNREGNFVITSFDGFNTDIFTPEDLARLDGDHWVYLALFDTHAQKVGVSKAERKVLRQIEQGSHQTLYIAKTPNGILARQIETCFRNSGLADKLQASTKKDFLCPEVPPETGEASLRATFEAHKNSVSDFPQLQPYLLEKPEFIDWSDHFGINYVNQSDKSFHNVKLKKDESVSGRIVAVKGPFLILETDTELVALCAKDLMGRMVDFDPLPAGLTLNSAFQGALF